MKKRWIMAAVVFVFASSVLSGSMAKADTADTVTYDAMDFEVFQNRTKEEIGKKYGEALYAGDSYVDMQQKSYYDTMYSLEDPYAAGKLTEDTHKTMTAMTNFYRWLVGVEPLKASSEHSDKLQAEAMVRNFEFNHYISDTSKPEDMSQEIWDYGARNSIHSILARYSTPRGSITSWMNEGYNLKYGVWDTVGHRYAIIDAALSDVQYGYCGSIGIGQEKAFDNTMNVPFTSYPAPGYMPANLVYSNSSAWSIQINKDILSIEDSSRLVVRVTNLDTSEYYECMVENQKLHASEYSSILSFVQPASGSEKRYSGTYRVDVSGLTDVESGKAAVLTYTTEFFDPTEYTPSYVKTVTADGIEKYIIYKSGATTENLKKIAYTLPDEVTVVAESGRRAKVPVTGNWVLNEKEQCWTNQADVSRLPADISDREHVLEKCAIYYEASDSVFDAFNSLGISPSEATIGESGYMTVHFSLISIDTSAIFQLVPQQDGSYIGKKRYDSRTSGEFDKEASEDFHVYRIEAFQESDAGEYIGISYNSSDTCAYVSTEIRTLTVRTSTQSGTEPPQGTTGGVESDSDTPSVVVTDTDFGEDQRSVNDSSESGATEVEDIREYGCRRVTIGNKKTITVKWGKVPKASGYQVQISTKKNFRGAKKITLAKNKKKYTFSKLKKKKKYYIRIRVFRSYKTDGGKIKKAYSMWTVMGRM